jgi:hypothetical protein
VIYFLDTSALAKRYLTEKGSLRVRRLLERKADVFVESRRRQRGKQSRQSLGESLSALDARVFLRLRFKLD